MVHCRVIDDWREIHVDVNVEGGAPDAYAALERSVARDWGLDPSSWTPRQFAVGGRLVTELNIQSIITPGCKIRVLGQGLADKSGAPLPPASPRGDLAPLRPSSHGARRLFVKVPPATGDPNGSRASPSASSIRGERSGQRPWDAIPDDLLPPPGAEASNEAQAGGRNKPGAKRWTPAPPPSGVKGYGAQAVPVGPHGTRTGKKRDHVGKDPFPLHQLGPKGVLLPTLPGVQGISLPPAALDIDIPELQDFNQDSVATAGLGEWMSSHRTELGAFSSTALYAEMRLHEALRNTQGLRVPNALRTTVVCQLMDELTRQLGSFGKIGTALWEEVVKSVYLEQDGKSLPYFLRHEQLTQDYAALNIKTQMMQAKLALSESRGEKRMAYARRTMANMSKDAMSHGWKMWKAHMTHQKVARQRLRKIIMRWKYARMTKAFDGWRFSVALIKEKRMMSRLEELGKIHNGFSVRARKSESLLPLETAEKEAVLAELMARRKKNEAIQGEISHLKDDLETAGMVLKLSRENEYREKVDIYREMGARIMAVEAECLAEECGGIGGQDVSPMLREGEAIDEMLKKHKPKVLRRWLNYHLESKSYPALGNLDVDLANGQHLVMVEHVLNEACSIAELESGESTAATLAKQVVANAVKHLQFPDDMMRDDGADITAPKPDYIFFLVAYLFEFYPNLKRKREAVHVAEEKVAECQRLCEELAAWDIHERWPPPDPEQVAAEEEARALAEAEAKAAREEEEARDAEEAAARAKAAAEGAAAATLASRAVQDEEDEDIGRRSSGRHSSGDGVATAAPAEPGPKGEDPKEEEDGAGGDGGGKAAPPRHAAEADFEKGNQPPPGGWRLVYEGVAPHPMIAALDALTAAQATVAAAREDSDRAQREFEKAARACSCYAYSMMGSRIAGEPMEVGAEVGTDVIKYTALDGRKLADILPAGATGEGVLEQLRDVLADHVGKLKPIYKYYSAGGAMNNQEYWKLVKECKFADKSMFGAKFDFVFKEANRELDEDGNFKPTSTAAADEADDDDNPDTELVPIELMECLVRIAKEKYKKSGGSLSEKLEKLIAENVLPNACQSDAGEFRNKMSEPMVTKVMQAHRVNLTKIFNSFSAADATSNAAAKNMGSMNQKELVILLKKIGVMQAGFTMRDVNQIFSLVQDAGDEEEGEGDEDDSELVFTEFLECIAVISIFRDPNPYIPFHKRLAEFLSDTVVAPLLTSLKLRKVKNVLQGTNLGASLGRKMRKSSARLNKEGGSPPGSPRAGAAGDEASPRPPAVPEDMPSPA